MTGFFRLTRVSGEPWEPGEDLRSVAAERGTGTDKSYQGEVNRNQRTHHGVFCPQVICPGYGSGIEELPHFANVDQVCSG